MPHRNHDGVLRHLWTMAFCRWHTVRSLALHDDNRATWMYVSYVLLTEEIKFDQHWYGWFGLQLILGLQPARRQDLIPLCLSWFRPFVLQPRNKPCKKKSHKKMLIVSRHALCVRVQKQPLTATTRTYERMCIRYKRGTFELLANRWAVLLYSLVHPCKQTGEQGGGRLSTIEVARALCPFSTLISQQGRTVEIASYSHHLSFIVQINSCTTWHGIYVKAACYSGGRTRLGNIQSQHTKKFLKKITLSCISSVSLTTDSLFYCILICTSYSSINMIKIDNFLSPPVRVCYV